MTRSPWSWSMMWLLPWLIQTSTILDLLSSLLVELLSNWNKTMLGRLPWEEKTSLWEVLWFSNLFPNQLMVTSELNLEQESVLLQRFTKMKFSEKLLSHHIMENHSCLFNLELREDHKDLVLKAIPTIARATWILQIFMRWQSKAKLKFKNKIYHGIIQSTWTHILWTTTSSWESEKQQRKSSITMLTTRPPIWVELNPQSN